jgi:rubrerythrin
LEQRAYEKTLKFAIRNEVKAHDFYIDAATKLQDSFLKELFTDLANEENNHKAILESFHESDTNTLPSEIPSQYNISESIDEPELSTKMKPADAFALAMKKEQEAMELYTWMANATSDLRQKELLLELAAMERIHKSRMENAFIDVAYPEIW